MKDKETLLELNEDAGPEQIGEQVQRAQEQLLQLKRQQDLIEKQKRELEELARRQEQLQSGKSEMVEKFTHSLVVLERQVYDCQKRLGQLKTVQENFIQHLEVIEAIQPKNWDGPEIQRELSRALSAVDDARAEFHRARALINDGSEYETLPSGDSSEVSHSGSPVEGSDDFMHWLKSGFAFTLPLLILGILFLLVLLYTSHGTR